MPEAQRAAVLMVGLGSLSYADAAQALNVPIGTLMARLHRGRERLRALLADPGQIDRAQESSSLSKVVP